MRSDPPGVTLFLLFCRLLDYHTTCKLNAKVLLSGGANILAANNGGCLPIHHAVSFLQSEVVKYLLQQLYATTRHLPLHELLEDLTWSGNPNSSGTPLLLTALHQGVLRTDDVVEIHEYLVDRNPELCSARDQGGSLPLHVACRRGAPFTIVQSLGESLQSLRQERNSSRKFAALPDMRDA
jgi:ankyrin repeat protein